ncbi:uncharacterized protein STEHIDRAFT_125756 [Stereum hirsutum FP-91666 SS1]|uniref:uncharacterized protein n=1 Tax=Stereum hirsutum (strain FP-91666) TaxID=721885 RepID=UPI000444990A|nr:uncharacterized protein STEHIDRAFT_125756 [Stereum hirsutum FP-91666 SS1]EIM80746.1 hypothetical protein STEHIDRAFT_125756 [Stereum hirsutum FP-91666 SS1]
MGGLATRHGGGEMTQGTRESDRQNEVMGCIGANEVMDRNFVFLGYDVEGTKTGRSGQESVRLPCQCSDTLARHPGKRK